MSFCDFLDFPDEYKVERKIEKEHFLYSANLTDAERKKVEEYIKEIEILYDIKLENEEIIVIYISLSYAKDRYTIYAICKAVASSIPYQCLFVFENSGFIKFCAPTVRRNKNNSYRSIVEEYVSTPFFGFDDMLLDRKLVYMIIDLKKCVEDEELRKNLMLNFSLAICSMNDEVSVDKNLGLLSFKDKVIQLEKFVKIINDNSFDTDNDNMLIGELDLPFDLVDVENLISMKDDDAIADISDLYDEYYDIATIDLVKDCFDYCYTMFVDNFFDYNTSPRLIELWLFSYVKACNKILHEEGLPLLSKYGYRRLKTEFDKCIYFDLDFRYYDELDEYLANFFEYFA